MSSSNGVTASSSSEGKAANTVDIKAFIDERPISSYQ